MLNRNKISLALFIATVVILYPFILKAETDIFSLSLPIDCKPNETCFIQNYVDIDPSDKAVDYKCNGSTYDGHKGVDIRLLSVAETKKGVSVLASAPGIIKAMRDGMADKLITDLNDPYIKNRQCGNGVVIDHGNGWETQYCHMLQNSILVQKGEDVKRGQKLGNVGFSGEAQFAHVHISVRHNGKIIDPFLGNGINNSCDTIPDTRNGLWADEVKQALTYKNGILIESGFSSVIVKPDTLEIGNTPAIPTSISTPAIIFYARFINLQQGDKINFSITGPSGNIVSNTTKPLERNKATYVAYSGKKRPETGWAQGEYLGWVKLLRNGKIIIYKEQMIKIE